MNMCSYSTGAGVGTGALTMVITEVLEVLGDTGTGTGTGRQAQEHAQASQTSPCSPAFSGQSDSLWYGMVWSVAVVSVD